MAHRERVSGVVGTRTSLLYLYPSEPLAAASSLPRLGLAMPKTRRSHRLALFLSSKRVRASTAPASPGHELRSVLKERCTKNFRCCGPCTHPAKRAATEIYSPIANNPPLSPGAAAAMTSPPCCTARAVVRAHLRTTAASQHSYPNCSCIRPIGEPSSPVSS
jgi:hypothetical protein